MPAVERHIIGLAWEVGIPVLEVGRLKRPETLTALGALKPDAIVVACFPRLLPQAILDLAPQRAFNIHPSLLPQYRGPEPLFWVFHDGLEHAGVTVHLMDAGADTGAIAAQQAVALPDSISYAAAERACSEVGARLLLDVLRATRDSRLTPQPQNPADASPAPVPTVDDFIITPDWSPRRASNFIRGMADWGQPIVIKS
jgi:methionyl-tRNA formyltransferase